VKTGLAEEALHALSYQGIIIDNKQFVFVCVHLFYRQILLPMITKCLAHKQIFGQCVELKKHKLCVAMFILGNFFSKRPKE
jgi:hypothetical protein